MKVFTYTKARQHLSELLDRASKEGEVRIKRKDGQEFVVKPKKKKGSPLDVRGIDVDISTEEIVQFIREGRRPM